MRDMNVTFMFQVGYTNAGKSTLLNRLTGADVLAEDKLFATLDPTTRRVQASIMSQKTLLSSIRFKTINLTVTANYDLSRIFLNTNNGCLGTTSNFS